jgi:two-component system, chemotaxis family, chemotaxis protein CheY
MGDKRVLVVDDAHTVRLYHRQALERAGFSVEEAGNGLEALEKALTTRFDALLVDVNMARMDGCTLVCSLRADPSIHPMPIIMISTEDGAEVRDQAYRAGANSYLVKPVRSEELVLQVRLATGGRP